MKNTFTICFKSKEFVGPPLILPITSPVTPYGPGCQFTWSPATASRLYPLPPCPRQTRLNVADRRAHLLLLRTFQWCQLSPRKPGRACTTCPSPLWPPLLLLPSSHPPFQPPWPLGDSHASSHTSGLLHLPHPRLICSSHRYKYTSLHLPLQAVTQKSPPREAFPSTTKETSTPTWPWNCTIFLALFLKNTWPSHILSDLLIYNYIVSFCH